jgi:hypothetical protein
MTPRQLFRAISSVSTAVAVLLGLNKSGVSTAQNLVPAVEGSKEKSFEPLVLKPTEPKVMDAFRFADHWSHSSHSSHASHSSHSSHYSSSFIQAPGAPTVAAANQEIMPNTGAGEIKLVRLDESRIREEPDTPVSRIQFRSGTILFGQVLVKSAAGITLQAQDRNIYKIPVQFLSDTTVAEFKLSGLTES